jgi:hypothetical protein
MITDPEQFPAKVMIRSFACALLAAITLKALNPFHNGRIVLFEVTYDRDTCAAPLSAGYSTFTGCRTVMHGSCSVSSCSAS